MTDEQQQGDRPKVVLETDTRPVVRDSEDNPVVRKLDLEQAIRPLDTRQKVGFAVVGAIGVANIFGVKAAAPESIPSAALQLLQQISQSI